MQNESLKFKNPIQQPESKESLLVYKNPILDSMDASATSPTSQPSGSLSYSNPIHTSSGDMQSR
jgi:hypothetical protein